VEGVEGRSSVTLVAGTDCEWADEKCANAVMDAFPANPQLNAIMTHGGMLKGASEGLKSIGRLYPAGDPNHVPMITIDENDSTCELIRDGWASAVAMHDAWVQTDYTFKTACHSVILGNAIPKEVFLPTGVVTHEMIVADWERDIPTVWGLIMLKGIDLKTLPVLYLTEYISTPTK
jgi:ABC-type sugar transport system substrate-binding protein